MSRNQIDDPFDPDAAMSQALKELGIRGFRAEKKTRYQLKVGPFNFYPAKGTIFKDGDQKALDKRGLPELIKMLEQLRRPRPGPDAFARMRRDRAQ